MTQEDPGLQDLVNDFVTESREHLAKVETDLLQLEEGDVGDHGERVNRVFRAVHSVKGVAGFLGFDTINKLSHALESVLDLVRKSRLDTSPELVDVLLAAIDCLRGLVEHVQESNQTPIDEQLHRLQHFLDAPAATAAAAQAAATELAAGEWLVEVDLVLPRIALARSCTVAEIVDSVAKLGRVVSGGSSLASKTEADASREPVMVTIATTLPPQELREQLFLSAEELRELRRPVQVLERSAPVVAPPALPTPRVELAVRWPRARPGRRRRPSRNRWLRSPLRVRRRPRRRYARSTRPRRRPTAANAPRVATPMRSRSVCRCTCSTS